MDASYIVYIAIAIAAVMGAVAWYAYVAEKKRTEAFKQVAHELGFEFDAAGDSAFLQSLHGLHLVSQGHSQKLWNLLRGKSHDLEVAIFDYSYVTGSGKQRRTWRQSVIGFRFEGRELPNFSLRPENVWHRMGTWLGQQDIDFDSHPTFSRSYLLRGSDEPAIRELFAPAVLDFYEEKTGLSTEGAGHTLLYYRHAKKIGPDDVRSFMEDGFAVLSLYR